MCVTKNDHCRLQCFVLPCEWRKMITSTEPEARRWEHPKTVFWPDDRLWPSFIKKNSSFIKKTPFLRLISSQRTQYFSPFGLYHHPVPALIWPFKKSLTGYFQYIYEENCSVNILLYQFFEETLHKVKGKLLLGDGFGSYYWEDHNWESKWPTLVSWGHA